MGSFEARSVPVQEGSEAFIELLNASGVKYIFVNPGSDVLPILEAVYKFQSLGRPCPELVLCQHESVAMSAAHGYFMLTEQPQVVLVHVDVGIQQVGGALQNAQRGMAGIVLCAGRAPWTSEGERPGSSHKADTFRTEQIDQATTARGYVKWDYELRCNANIHHVVQRAFQIAGTEPHGPVLLSLPRELLMERIEAVQLLSRESYGPPASPGPDPTAIAEAARLLAQAQSPLAITSYLGRHPGAVAPLVKLAETLGMRVVSDGMRMSFPTGHPLWAGTSAGEYLKDADVILVVDHQAPWDTSQLQPAPGAQIIYIDIDPLKASYPLWDYPAHIRLQTDSGKALTALGQTLSPLITAQDKGRFQERLQRLQKGHEEQRAKWESSSLAKAGNRPISPEWLSYCLSQELDDGCILMDELIGSCRRHMVHHIRRTRPGTLFNAGGTSLGWGLGGALGAKLAAPEKTVVCLTGDGSFIFGNPVVAFWASHRYQAPFLTIIYNNGGYRSPTKTLLKLYGQESYAARWGKWEGFDFTPVTSYARIAEAAGAYGVLVEDPDKVRAAIKDGLERVKGGQSVVLDVKLETD